MECEDNHHHHLPKKRKAGLVYVKFAILWKCIPKCLVGLASEKIGLGKLSLYSTVMKVNLLSKSSVDFATLIYY